MKTCWDEIENIFYKSGRFYKNKYEMFLKIKWDPLESADVDKCITFCKYCHKKVHKIPGCEYKDLRCIN